MCRLDPTVAIGIIHTITAPNIDSAGNKAPSLLETFRSDTGINPVEINLGDKWYKMNFSPELDQNEQPTGRTIVTTTDITKEKLLEAELDKTQEELNNTRHGLIAMIEDQRKRDQNVREITAAVAHDLKNPLSIVKGYAQILQRQTEALLPDTAKSHLDIIVKNADRMTQTINDLLNDAIVSSELKSEPLIINNFLPKVCLETQDAMAFPNVAISLPLSEVTTNTDARKLALALKILITNAFQTVEENTIKKVIVAAETEGEHLEILVADNGPGVSEEAERGMFDGYSSKRGTKQQGTGLGLSLARKLANRLGGEVCLKHTVNAQTLHEHPEYKHTGSIFALRIPLS